MGPLHEHFLLSYDEAKEILDRLKALTDDLSRSGELTRFYRRAHEAGFPGLLGLPGGLIDRLRQFVERVERERYVVNKVYDW